MGKKCSILFEQTPQKIWLHPPPLPPSQNGHAFYKGDSLSLLLQQKNIDINVIEREFTENTAISLAIACDNHEGLALLLQQPGLTTINHRDGAFLRTPLMSAVARNNIDCVRLLLQHPEVDLDAREVCHSIKTEDEVSRYFIHVLFLASKVPSRPETRA